MDYLEKFKTSLEAKKTDQHTITVCLSDIKHFQTWLWAIYNKQELNPSSITGLDIASYKTNLVITEDRKPAGVNRSLSSLCAFLDWSKSQGYITDNPVINIPKVKPIMTPAKTLIDKDYNKLMREVYQSNDNRDIALIELMVGAGLRIGELTALTIHDIIATDRKGLVTVRNSERTIYRQVRLNKDIRKAINSYLVERPICSSEALFINQKGKPFSANNIWRVLKKYGLSIGEITPHSLRHTHSSQQLIRKTNIEFSTVRTLM
jgi:integrase/recombinase XerD